jgi:multidrug efflux system membrane fusion protein
VDQYRAQIKNDQAHIKHAKAQLEYMTVRAPLVGRVCIRQIDQGNVVHAADARPVVVIVQLQAYLVAVPVGALAKTNLSIGRVKCR